MRQCGTVKSSVRQSGLLVGAALPGYSFDDAYVEVASEEEEDENGKAEDGEGDVGGGKVGFGCARVEAPEDTGPDDPEEDAGKLRGEEPEGGDEGDNGDEEEVEQAQERHGDGMGEEEGEVLGPAFEHGGSGAVHAGGEGVGGVAEADGIASALDVVSEGNILEDAGAEGLVAAGVEVGLGLYEEELTVGGGGAVGGRVDAGGGVGDGELGEDERHGDALEEAGGELAGGVGDQGDLILLELVAGAGEIAGLMEGVGVGEEEEGAAGDLGSGEAGVVLAGEMGGVECGGLEDADAGVGSGGLSQDFGGAVGGGVVYEDELPVGAEGEAGFRLGEEGFEAGGEGGFLVAGGNDDGEEEAGGVVCGGLLR